MHVPVIYTAGSVTVLVPLMSLERFVYGTEKERFFKINIHVPSS